MDSGVCGVWDLGTVADSRGLFAQRAPVSYHALGVGSAPGLFAPWQLPNLSIQIHQLGSKLLPGQGPQLDSLQQSHITYKSRVSRRNKFFSDAKSI